MPPITDPTPADTREPTVLLEDLTSGLLWPRLLRAAALALRPERVILGTVAWILILAIGSLNTLWSESPAFIEIAVGANFSAIGALWESLISLDGEGVVGALTATAQIPGGLIEAYPLSVFVLGIPIVLIWALFGGAISRSAAVEFSSGRVIAWQRALGMAGAKWVSLIGAILAPLAVVVALALVLAVCGLLFAVPVVSLAPALLYPIALILGAIAVIVLVLWALGRPMLIPGVACEGTDALDAIQRAFAYVFARPGRLVLYMLVLAVQGLVLYAVVAAIVAGIISFTGSAAGAFVGDRADEIIGVREIPGVTSGERSDGFEFARVAQDEGATPAESDAGAGGVSGPIATHGWSRRIVAFWVGALELLLGGLVISFYFTAGTLLYLIMRRVCDGQEPAELWTPGPES